MKANQKDKKNKRFNKSPAVEPTEYVIASNEYNSSTNCDSDGGNKKAKGIHNLKICNTKHFFNHTVSDNESEDKDIDVRVKTTIEFSTGKYENYYFKTSTNGINKIVNRDLTQKGETTSKNKRFLSYFNSLKTQNRDLLKFIDKILQDVFVYQIENGDESNNFILENYEQTVF